MTVGTTEYVTSQMFVDDAQKAQIYDWQPNYQPTSGAGYVPNTSDQVIDESGLAVANVVLSTKQQSDGALLAWVAIALNA